MDLLTPALLTAVVSDLAPLAWLTAVAAAYRIGHARGRRAIRQRPRRFGRATIWPDEPWNYR